jgi:hypothetical protein
MAVHRSAVGVVSVLLALLVVSSGAHPSEISYLSGSTEKICQLTGETDRERGQPTLNRTESRFGLVGTDLGSSFEHDGKLYFLFGDTIKARSGRGREEEGGPRQGRGNDSIAFTDDVDPEDCLRLQFVTDPGGRFHSPEVPGVSLLGFEVPTGGFSLNGTMYVFFTTDHGEQRVMGRSVLARSRDGAQSFELLYTISTEKFINIAPVVVDTTEVPGLPKDDGQGVLLWGSGRYRRSDPFLAYLPGAGVEQRESIRFFAGLEGNGRPRWSADEADAVPLFAHPCVGELSVAWNRFIKKWLMLYNCNDPRGINFRTSETPWGPWSEAQVLFNPWEDNGYCHFMHVSWEFRRCDSVHDPGRENVWGGEYGPYMIPSFTTGDESRTTIFFTMSTWNPYNVVLMRAELESPR